MLDLVAVAAQMRRMREGLSTLAHERAPRLEEAIASWGRAQDMGHALRERLARARTSWLVAEPLEPLGSYPVSAAGGYRVVASDGSQILPERHEMAGCYLVNVGTCEIDYGSGTADLRSAPTLHWAPEDLYPLVGGVRQEADGRVVGALRFEAECRALEDALGDDEPVLLSDGTLVLWWLEPDPDRLRGLDPKDVKQRTFAALTRLMARARERGALLAGYLSSPRATDVVSMLKVVVCTEDPVDCDRCPYDLGTKTWSPRRAPVEGERRVLPVPVKPCEEVDPLADAALFKNVLGVGERSPRFRSAAKITGAYDAPIDFVYLHTGGEIARVEFPGWTTPSEMERLVGALADQCSKGLGYPVSLAEAHEQAVVRATDRRAFEDLVRRGGMGAVTAKLARKRVGIL